MIVKHHDLADCTRVLELQYRFLLHAHYNDILASYADLVGVRLGQLEVHESQLLHMSPFERLQAHTRPRYTS